MDVEVFVYGVSVGNCFYGKADDKIYFDTFYNRDKENYLSVTIRRNGDNKVYCYYNYLVYQNVIGKNGRSGSFFGITLRLDAYCIDMQNIYRILDTVFNSYIKGELLESVGNNLRYVVDDFSDTSKLEFIKDSLIGLFSQTFKGKGNVCFAPIDHTFMLGREGFYRINLYDYSDENIYRLVRDGDIRLSPYYPTQEISRQIQQHEKQKEEIRQQYELARKTDLEEKSKLISSLSESKNQIIKLQAEIEQRNKSIEQLTGKIKSIERAKDIEHLIGQIKLPIEKISDYIGHTAPVVADEIVKQGRKWYSRIFEIISKGVPFFNLILILVVLLCVNGYIRLNHSEDKDMVRLTEEINSLKDEKRELEKQLEVSRIPEKGITIDITDLKDKVLKKGNTYHIRANFSEKSFQWKVEGAELNKGKDGIFPLTVSGDTIRIRLLMNKETVAERTILSK